jgi:DNA-binding NtrC family response regulator
MVQVLIVDDERRLADGLKTRLVQEGFRAETVHTGKKALQAAKTSIFDVCILDIRLPDIDGIQLLCKLKELQPNMECIMLTGFASLDTAIESIKLGAYDYLTKPYKLSHLENVIKKAHEKKLLKEKTIILQEQLHRVDSADRFVGESKVIKETMKHVALVAPSDVPVLIQGETGTGKELIARAIHETSPRSANPFVAINSSTLQENILESELFGYKRGAFTGAQNDKIGLLEIANRGTFFIDEVGDMSPSIQAKLLRTLETGRFRRLGDTREISTDVRFVCATNKNLEVEVEQKRFRQDLFYRLNTFVITLTPLRNRKDDIALLCEYFMRKFTRGSHNKRISAQTMTLLNAYDWPGNVRELANVLERAVLLSMTREEIVIDDLPQGMVQKVSTNRCRQMTLPELPDDILTLDELEKRYIQHVLDRVGNNKSKAARLLNVSRTKLYSRIE